MNNTQRRMAGLTVGGLGVCAIGAVLLSEHEPATAPATETAATVAQRGTAEPDAALVAATATTVDAPRARAGDVLEHALRLSGELRAGDAPRARLAIEGTRTTTRYREDAQGAVIGVRFDVRRAQLEGLQPALAEAIRTALRRPREVLLDLDPQGALRGLALLDPPAHPLVRDQLRSWATHPHLVAQAGARWSAPGWDALGEAQDTYIRQGELIERTRRLSGQGPASPQLRGSLQAQVRDGRLTALVGTETIRLPLGDGGASLTREVWLELQRERRASAAQLERVRRQLAELSWERELVSEASSVEPPARPFADLLPALRQGKGALNRLARSLRSSPGAIAAALRAFPSLPEAGQRRLLSALGRADTLASQRALLDLARGALSDRLVPTAFAALGQLAYPFAETISFLHTQSQAEAGSERQRWGTLGLGLVAKNAVEEDAANRAAVLLQDNLADAPRPQRLVTLSALGNGGREVSFEAVAEHAQDGDAEVRARALFALRDVDVEEAQVLLRGGALEDPAPSVRREAVHGLALRGPTPDAVATLGEALRADADVSVRLEALSGVAIWLTVRRADLEPSTRQDLERLLLDAQRDPDAAVRHAAQAALH